jgi:transposase-like protein
MSEDFPQTLVEAIRYFSNPQTAFDFMVKLRWPDGVKCPRCKSSAVSFISPRKTWECKCCTERKQFSVKVGTIFEDSALGLDKWLAAIWMIANDKNGVSSYEVHRAIGVTQKTAWFMLHRIRLAMQTGTFEKMSGEVEADETYIGGLAKNMQIWRDFFHCSRNPAKKEAYAGNESPIVASVVFARSAVI